MNKNAEPSNVYAPVNSATPIGNAVECELDPSLWEVEVRIAGETVLTIGRGYLAGIPDIDRYQRVVWTCAEHLRSFIGDPDRPADPCFACGGSEQERWVGRGGTEEVGPCSVCCAPAEHAMGSTAVPARSNSDGSANQGTFHMTSPIFGEAEGRGEAGEVAPRPYEKFAVKPGDEVWVRATVTDNCTSCCGVRIPTIHREVLGSYVRPQDVIILSPPLPGPDQSEEKR